MGYLSLYRKWRPKTFDDLAGQTVVVKTLKNALTSKRIAHAYLFCGPRGTGKTSTAKLFAKALNCEHGPTTNPCNQCFSCEQVNSGRSVDVIEIDAASNRRIDEIRDLREKVKFSPSEGDYKVYIIDEVHMLTKEAFNALLKTLEEPPQNVVFILATTEPHKLLPTIISRCQRFDFGLLSVRELKERLRYICEQESIAVEENALELIARTAEGGMRDAISMLDQAIAFGGEKVTVDDVNAILGKVDREMLAGIVQVILDHNTENALKLVNEIIDQGKDMNQFVKDLLFHFRDLMLIKECGAQNTIQDLPQEVRVNLADQANHFNMKEILRILEILSETDQQLKFAAQPRLVLEMTMIKLVSRDADATVTNLIQRIAKLEEQLHSGVFVAAANPAAGRDENDGFSDKIRQMRANAGVGAQSQQPQTIDSRRAVGSTQTEQNAANRPMSPSSATGNAAPFDTTPAKAADSSAVPFDNVSPKSSDIDAPPFDVTPASASSNNTASYDINPANPAFANHIPPDTDTDANGYGDEGSLQAGRGVAAGAAGTDPIISMEEFMSHWNVTMNLLNKSTETRKLRAFLVVGKPQLIIGDTLYVVYPPTSTFHKSNAEKEAHLLEKALLKVTGLNLKARCVFEGEEPRIEASRGAGGINAVGATDSASSTLTAGLAGTVSSGVAAGGTTGSTSTSAGASSAGINSAGSSRGATSTGATLGSPNMAGSTSSAVADDPLVQKTLKIFGGKIIHIENE